MSKKWHPMTLGELSNRKASIEMAIHEAIQEQIDLFNADTELYLTSVYVDVRYVAFGFPPIVTNVTVNIGGLEK